MRKFLLLLACLAVVAAACFLRPPEFLRATSPSSFTKPVDFSAPVIPQNFGETPLAFSSNGTFPVTPSTPFSIDDYTVSMGDSLFGLAEFGTEFHDDKVTAHETWWFFGEWSGKSALNPVTALALLSLVACIPIVAIIQFSRRRRPAA